MKSSKSIRSMFPNLFHGWDFLGIFLVVTWLIIYEFEKGKMKDSRNKVASRCLSTVSLNWSWDLGDSLGHSCLPSQCVHSLRSKRSRTKRTKFGPRKGVFHIREGNFPSPTPFLPPFCSRPIFRASRMRKTNGSRPEFRSLRTGTLVTHASVFSNEIASFFAVF